MESFIHKNKIILGATPKLIASARLSSSAPKRENALSSLAESPSIMSKHAATKIHITAFSQSESNANRIPVNPVHKPIVVKIFGKSLEKERFFAFDFIGFFFYEIRRLQVLRCLLGTLCSNP